MSAKAKGPLGSLNEQDASYLIELFQSKQELWDPRRPNYRNRQLKTGLWLSMKISFSSTTGIDCTVDHIQAKVASLRNTFSREMRKINKTKVSGAAACDVYNSSWPFFQQLKFLLLVMSLVTPTSSNLEIQVNPQMEEDPFHQPQREEEVSGINCEGDQEEEEAVVCCSSNKEDPAVLLTARSDYKGADKTPAKRARKDQEDELAECVIDYYKNKKNPNEDPELIWAKCLIQKISAIPDATERQIIKLDIEDLVSKSLRKHLAKKD